MIDLITTSFACSKNVLVPHQLMINSTDSVTHFKQITSSNINPPAHYPLPPTSSLSFTENILYPNYNNPPTTAEEIFSYIPSEWPRNPLPSSQVQHLTIVFIFVRSPHVVAARPKTCAASAARQVPLPWRQGYPAEVTSPVRRSSSQLR